MRLVGLGGNTDPNGGRCFSRCSLDHSASIDMSQVITQVAQIAGAAWSSANALLQDVIVETKYGPVLQVMSMGPSDAVEDWSLAPLRGIKSTDLSKQNRAQIARIRSTARFFTTAQMTRPISLPIAKQTLPDLVTKTSLNLELVLFVEPFGDFTLKSFQSLPVKFPLAIDKIMPAVDVVVELTDDLQSLQTDLATCGYKSSEELQHFRAYVDKELQRPSVDQKLKCMLFVFLV